MTLSGTFTDCYQLTMAQGYLRLGKAQQRSVFYLFFRENPFNGEYSIFAGLEQVVEYLKNFSFTKEDLAYLKKQTTPDGKQLFDKSFLRYLKKLTFTCDVDAVDEGTVVFGKEPLLRIQGPLIQCHLLETAILNLINLPTLVATKAARTCHAAQGDPVIEFGLRRTQGPNGGLTASRAAYIGGCTATSNVMAGKHYNIPISGTVAHSWVMSFPDELSSFNAYTQAYEDNIVLLVDTYQTEQGIDNAISVAQRLKAEDRSVKAIRLDSGDLNTLSKLARERFNEAGFNNVEIIVSGNLDEHRIQQLKLQQAPIDAWGVGTRLSTAYDQPALDIAYKLCAIEDAPESWRYPFKVSDDPIKRTIPGIPQTRRYYKDKQWVGDYIYSEHQPINDAPWLSDSYTDLLQPVFRKGRYVGKQQSIEDIREFAREQVSAFHDNAMTPYSVVVDDKLIK